MQAASSQSHQSAASSPSSPSSSSSSSSACARLSRGGGGGGGRGGAGHLETFVAPKAPTARSAASRHQDASDATKARGHCNSAPPARALPRSGTQLSTSCAGRRRAHLRAVAVRRRGAPLTLQQAAPSRWLRQPTRLEAERTGSISPTASQSAGPVHRGWAPAHVDPEAKDVSGRGRARADDTGVEHEHAQ